MECAEVWKGRGEGGGGREVGGLIVKLEWFWRDHDCCPFRSEVRVNRYSSSNILSLRTAKAEVSWRMSDSVRSCGGMVDTILAAVHIAFTVSQAEKLILALSSNGCFGCPVSENHDGAKDCDGRGECEEENVADNGEDGL